MWHRCQMCRPLTLWAAQTPSQAPRYHTNIQTTQLRICWGCLRLLPPGPLRALSVDICKRSGSTAHACLPLSLSVRLGRCVIGPGPEWHAARARRIGRMPGLGCFWPACMSLPAAAAHACVHAWEHLLRVFMLHPNTVCAVLLYQALCC